MEGFLRNSVFLITIYAVTASSHSGEPGRSTPLWQDFSPEGARLFCQNIAYDYSVQHPEYEFLKLIQNGHSTSIDELRISLKKSPNKYEEIGFIFSVGDSPLVSALWPDIKNYISQEPKRDWQWHLPAIAVMCSNDEMANFIFEQGFSQNQYLEGVGDFMITAIAHRDIEMARILFEKGYTQCERKTGKGESLDDLAIRLGFEEYLPLFAEYCNTDPDN